MQKYVSITEMQFLFLDSWRCCYGRNGGFRLDRNIDTRGAWRRWLDARGGCACGRTNGPPPDGIAIGIVDLGRAEVATGLLRNLTGAINGTSLYRRASFLLGREDEDLFDSALIIADDPHRPRGLGELLLAQEQTLFLCLQRGATGAPRLFCLRRSQCCSGLLGTWLAFFTRLTRLARVVVWSSGPPCRAKPRPAACANSVSCSTSPSVDRPVLRSPPMITGMSPTSPSRASSSRRISASR